ncbi:hypothetical protein NPIL_677611 [Nephila pilipes]|uniref:Uncharacterized protein n=1 Tax=Nephila pilipes TaxID=299642 RepID=A0A8X6PFX4_NEPPI|nr:hypothetical protein NPIL_677611 [Nephila pilipes]
MEQNHIVRRMFSRMLNEHFSDRVIGLDSIALPVGINGPIFTRSEPLITIYGVIGTKCADKSCRLQISKPPLQLLS